MKPDHEDDLRIQIMKMISLSIECFGAFKVFGDMLCVDVPRGSSVRQVKDILTEKLGDDHKMLVNRSILANDTCTLSDTYIMQEARALSILPPVCGG